MKPPYARVTIAMRTAERAILSHYTSSAVRRACFEQHRWGNMVYLRGGLPVAGEICCLRAVSTQA